ncbi:hypothetical protein GRX03_09855 [Halovenus sp. WSH3]|uniref:Uncharacterized protein n=1 Tax=Halovenus carboxidivorans TaxID=2692199 RepID=A0A6B0T4K9_9EURY|nr:hypothetical protein [Halovenus carboxidivorans]MXR51907.1 hypothetical protein [Halovenus carboxidivorans]
MERPDPDTERDRTLSRLRIGFVVLIGISAGLIASYAQGSPAQILIAVGGGTAVGIGLVWLAFPEASKESPEQMVRRR